MAKKYTWDKNGKMTSEDEKPDNEHFCPYKDKIILTDKRMNGDENDPGIFSEVKTVIKYMKFLISTFALTFVAIMFWGITDHTLINDFPYKYIDRTFMNQVLENQSKLNYMIQSAELKNTSDIEMINKQLEIINKQFDFMRTTRGGTVQKNPTKEP